MPSKPIARVYFENLNSIRFIAALLVIVQHIEQFKSLLKLDNYLDNKIILIIGKLGVIMFFSLSGFLISYLLFIENSTTKTIHIKDFYIRRILRIWPLYFLIVFTALFILPFFKILSLPDYPKDVVWNHFFYKFALYVAFLPNIVLTIYGLIPYASQTWSIGAEEQFYLIWPYLNKVVKNKWLLMISVIFIYLSVKFLVPHFFAHNWALDLFNQFWLSIPIDCMAIGGLFALVLFEKTAFTTYIKNILFSRLLQWFVLSLTIICIANGIYFPYFHYEVYAVLFTILISNFAANKNRIFTMEYNWISYLGKISYGMYMFHPIAIVLSIRLLLFFGLLRNSLLYPISLVFIVILSSISYEFFEKFFIKKKMRYSKILSGDDAKELLLTPKSSQ